jgi:Zn-dependent peptidase ImmA (M78 family)
MNEDYIVPPRSTKKVEEIALAWRDALGAPNDWAPDMIDLLENRLPTFFPSFALVVRPDHEMGDAEAFTEFNPPQIVVRESVYRAAARRDGRSRMTLAHELGHLVMHAGVQTNPRMTSGNQRAPTHKIYETAEWQAKKFASLFLMPTHVVRQFASADEVVAYCLVSQQAALIRFNEVDRVSAKSLPECVEDAIVKLERANDN